LQYTQYYVIMKIIMRSPEGFSGGDATAEAYKDPEVTELLDFLGSYKKIQEIMAWLVEASAEADFTIKAVRRGHLHNLMAGIGLDPESPEALSQLENMKAGLTDRIKHPKPRVAVPDAGFFKSRIKELVSEQAQYGDPEVYDYAVGGVSDLVDLARFGHTDWSSVRSRTGTKDVSEWIHGVAEIMADPVAYQAEFAGLGLDTAHRATDHIEVSYDWSIGNGRHRSLATRSLGEEYVLEAGMSQWIPVTVEQQ
jgi:hypothetical protein